MNLETPPFELGETLSGTHSDGTTLINYDWLGEVFPFPANRLEGANFRTVKTRWTGKGVKAVALRNVSGGVLVAKRLVIVGTGYDSTHLQYGHQGVTGFNRVVPDTQANAFPVVIVDPWLTLTVPDNDIFWGVIEGRVLVKKSYAATPADIAVGAALMGATLNTTTGNTTGGGLGLLTAVTNNSTSVLFLGQNIVGYAISAMSSTSTNTDMLVDLAIRHYN